MSSVAKQSLVGLWVVINSLQLLRYIPMFHLYLSRSVFMFLSYISFVNMENQFLSYLFELHFNKDHIKHENIDNYRFPQQGITSYSILLTCGDIFMLIIFILLFYFFIFLLTLWFKTSSEENKLQKSEKYKEKTNIK